MPNIGEEIRAVGTYKQQDVPQRSGFHSISWASCHDVNTANIGSKHDRMFKINNRRYY